MNTLVEFLKLMVCSLAVSAVAITVTKSNIAKPFRVWVKDRSSFLGDLFSCPYCASHWGSFIITLIIFPRVVQTEWLVLDFLITVFAIVGMAAWFAKIIILAYRE